MSDDQIPHLNHHTIEVSEVDTVLHSLLKTAFNLDKFILIAFAHCEEHGTETLELHSRGLTPASLHTALIDVAAATANGGGTDD